MGKRTGSGPQFVRYFPSVLQALRELGGSARPAEVVDWIVKNLSISDAVQSEFLPSGQPRFDNQVAWARFYLAKAGLIDTSKHGVWTLTESGRQTALTDKQALDVFRSVQRTFRAETTARGEESETETPEDGLVPDASVGVSLDHRNVLSSLLQSLSPEGFERFSQRLLREAGFQEVTVTGKSGDGGIDGIGILQINPLVSFKVLFQCKKYKAVVGASQIRDFRGAMQGRADKGIIITTGAFTSDAKKEAIRDGVPPIELVDAEKLMDMLESLKLGLIPVEAYRVDEKFFDEYRAKETAE